MGDVNFVGVLRLRCASLRMTGFWGGARAESGSRSLEHHLAAVKPWRRWSHRCGPFVRYSMHLEINIVDYSDYGYTWPTKPETNFEV